MDKIIHDLQFPLQNLKSINDGLCRYCPFKVTAKSENDIKELQNHYLTNHPVREVKGNIPAKSTLKQRRNSDSGKSHLKLYTYKK